MVYSMESVKYMDYYHPSMLSYLLPSHQFLSHVQVFLFCFFDPLSLSKAVCVTMDLELSTGAWMTFLLFLF